MLYLVSSTDDPTAEECSVYEATSAGKALEKAADDGWGDEFGKAGEGHLHVFEVKKTSHKKFVRRTMWVNADIKRGAA